MKNFFLLLFILFACSACYRLRSSDGGGQIKEVRERKINTNDIALTEGFHIEPIASGLNFPTGIAIDEQGLLFVTESGYAYGEVWTTPSLIRIDPDGRKTTMAIGNKNGPWNGVYYHRGHFYIAEGGQMEGGRILKVDYEGHYQIVAENLPGYGDHHTNGPVIRNDYIYFAQGSATNSAVVGKDNLEFGWLNRQPTFHEIPCKDITLTGENFETEHLLSARVERASTGAFSPFGTPTSPGQVIRGQIPCTGAILRTPLEGGDIELVAWGLRNPYGLSFSPDGRLFVTENSYDNRGSRPIWGAGDVLWEIRQGLWYGYPDFSAGKSLSTDEFKPPGEPIVRPLMEKYPNEVPKPSAILGVHSSSNGFAFSTSDEFGYRGQAFIAQFGDMAPGVGKVTSPVGFKIIRVDTKTGVVEDFIVNKGRKNGPASWHKHGGLERPNDVIFSDDGKTMYIVDFGILKTTKEGPRPQENTGVIWKVTRK
jgi:hypothetical protein